MRIGLFGGSFNPIHNGHIALARQMVEKGRLDEVWFMVSPQNPLKKQDDLAPDDVRLEWAREALKDEPQLLAKDYEFHLPRPSYTWDTLQALSRDFPQHTFTLVIGADNWLVFDRWAHTADIIAHYPIVIYPREGSPIDVDALPESVRLVQMPLYNVSSTDVRQRIREGRPVRRLLPKNAYDDIVEAYQGK